MIAKIINETILFLCKIVQIDENNKIIGPIKRSEMRKEKLWHRASYIFVFTTKNELFVQKRVMTKDYCPGYYDTSSGGVVGYIIDKNTNKLIRETLIDNAYRELEEEMGIKNIDLKFYGMFPYSDEKTNVWGSLWLCIIKDGTIINIQEEEVECVELKPIDIIENEYKNGVKYCKDGIFALNVLQERMKSNQIWNVDDYQQ